MQQKSLRYMFAGTSPQLLAVISGTVSAIADGMHYGWSAPILPTLDNINKIEGLTEDNENWIENMYLVGGLVGVPCTIYLVDKIGRKKCVLMSAVLNLLSWILIGIATNIEMLFAARLMAGIAGNVAFVACPMYIAEIADQKIRGFLATLIYLMMLAGILLIYSIGPYTSLYVSSIVGGSFLVMQLVSFPFMPESPYFLLYKGKHEAARKSLLKLRSSPNIDKELEEISAAVERQKNERGRPQDLFKVKGNRKALIVMVVLNGAQHFSSISVILMNMHAILIEAGSIYVESRKAAIIFSAIMLLSASLASLIVDRFGRKILLATSSLLTGACLLTLAIYFHLKRSGYDVAGASWIPVACVLSYALCFKLGLGIVPIVLTAELFPAKVKAMGMAMADASYMFFALMSVYIYQHTSAVYGMHLPFYIFAASTLGTATFVICCVPETRGKSLEEIQMILKGSVTHDVIKRDGVNENKYIVNENEFETHM